MTVLALVIGSLSYFPFYGLPADRLIECRVEINKLVQTAEIRLRNKSDRPVSILDAQNGFSISVRSGSEWKVLTAKRRDVCGPMLTIESWRILGRGESLIIPHAIDWRAIAAAGRQDRLLIRYRYPISLFDMLPSDNPNWPKDMKLRSWSPLGDRFVGNGRWLAAYSPVSGTWTVP